MPVRARSVVMEGLIAGFLGATSVAIWFFVVDLIRGRPFLVPAALGHGVLHSAGMAGEEGFAAHVAVYTVVHYAAFAVVGVLAALMLRRADRHPAILAGAFILFVVFEIGFLSLTAAISDSPTLGVPSWMLVSVGNIIAAIVMGVYFWRVHPGLGGRIDSALGGDGSDIESRAD